MTKMQRAVRMRRWQFVAFCLLIGLLLVTRFYRLDSRPPILNADEASIAYNAYLLLETGHDEWQQRWPLVLKAFGDQKIGGYTYLTVVSFWLLGVSELAVRVPVAVAGVISVVVTGWLVWKWSNRRGLALIVMALMTIQPVFIWYSRVAFEATVSLLLILVLLGLLYGDWSVLTNKIKSRVVRALAWVSYWLIMVVLGFGSVFFYNAPLVLLPFLVLPLPVWKGWRNWRAWLAPVALVMSVWVVALWSFAGLTAQKSQITIFSDAQIAAAYPSFRTQFDSPVVQKILGNRYVYYGLLLGERFVASFDPAFLMTNQGGHPWHSFPESGYLTWPVYILGWWGVFLSVREIALVRRWRLLAEPELRSKLLWLYFGLIALLPSIITVNAPHATRTIMFFVVWAVFAGIALEWLAELALGLSQWLIERGWRIGRVSLRMVVYVILMSGVAAIVVWPSGQYLQTVLLSDLNPVEWGGLRVGYEEVLNQFELDHPSEVVTVADLQGFLYITTAWYLRLSPEEFWSTVERQPADTVGFTYGSAVGRYRFVYAYQINSAEGWTAFWQEQATDESSEGWQVKRR